MLFTRKNLLIALSILSIHFVIVFLSNTKGFRGTPSNKNCVWRTEETILGMPDKASNAEAATMVVVLFNTLKEKAEKNCQKYGMVATFENPEKLGTMVNYMKEDGQIIWVDGDRKKITKDTLPYFFTPLEHTKLGKLWRKKKFKRLNKIYVNYKCTKRDMQK